MDHGSSKHSHGGSGRHGRNSIYARAEQLEYLYEADLDILHNEKDKEFVSASNHGNSIRYFIDTNVLRCFISPKGDISHGDYGSIAGIGDPDASRTDRDVVMMITSGYIFSPLSLGNTLGNLFLTPWHRAEVHTQLYETKKRIASNLIMCADEVRAFAERYKKIGSNFSSTDSYLKFDTLCKILVEDQTVSPMTVMHWIAARNFFPSVESAFNFDSAQVRGSKDFQKECKEWIDILHAARPSSSMSKIENDAKSISFLHWLSREKADEHQKFVLVTADRTLSRCYRKWYYAEENGGSGNYVIRNISQYLPQINLVDSGVVDVDLGGTRGVSNIFASIKNGITGITQQVKLFAISNQSGENGERERTRIKALERNDFLRAAIHIADTSRDGFWETVDDNLRSLSNFESGSKYLYEKILARRVPSRSDIEKIINDDSRKELLKNLLASCADYLHETIRDLMASLESFSLDEFHRIPRTIRYKVGDDFLWKIVEQEFMGDVRLRSARSHLQIETVLFSDLFATLFGLSISKHSAREARLLAKENAELCLSAYLQFEHDGDGRDEEKEGEIRFMCALANRFLLGGSADTIRAKHRYDEAKRHIDDISKKTPDFYARHSNRIRSENEALELFRIARSCSFDRLTESKLSEIEQVQVSLRSIIAGMGWIGENASRAGVDDYYLRIQTQVIHNIASCYNLLAIIKIRLGVDLNEGGWLDCMQSDTDLIVSIRKILDVWEADAHSSSFLRAELYYFLAMVNPDQKSDYLKQCFGMCRQLSRSNSMPIDEWQATQMEKYFIA